MIGMSAAREPHSCVGIWFDLLNAKAMMISQGQNAFCDDILYSYYDLVRNHYIPNGGATKIVCFGDTVYGQVRPELYENRVPSPVAIYQEIVRRWPSLQLYVIVSHGEVWGKLDVKPQGARNFRKAYGRCVSGQSDDQGVDQLASQWEFGLSKPLDVAKQVEKIAGDQKWGAGVFYQGGAEDFFNPPLRPSRMREHVGSLDIYEAVIQP